MVSDDGQIALVFNGEIYNFKDLRHSLESSGVGFRGHSDTEVILRLYEQRRPATDQDWSELLRSLNGIFALAIWDSARGELVVARDALGVKPLYYLTDDGCFAFASELKALLHLAKPPQSTDPIAIRQYLTFLWTPGERTLWTGARKLEPGSMLRVRSGQELSRSVWYQLPCTRLRSPALRHRQARKGQLPCTNSHKGWTDESDPVTHA
jgi:asparagine synthase (glutamine-hydrolysing)